MNQAPQENPARKPRSMGGWLIALALLIAVPGVLALGIYYMMDHPSESPVMVPNAASVPHPQPSAPPPPSSPPATQVRLESMDMAAFARRQAEERRILWKLKQATASRDGGSMLPGGSYLAFARDADVYASRGEKEVTLWNLNDLKKLRSFEAPGGELLHVLALTPDGRQLAVLTNVNEIQVFQTSDGTLLKKVALTIDPDNLKGGAALFSIPRSVFFTDDGKLLIAEHEHNPKYERFAAPSFEKKPFKKVSDRFSISSKVRSDGRYALIEHIDFGAGRNVAIAWDLVNDTQVDTYLQGAVTQTHAHALTHDGRFILVSESDGPDWGASRRLYLAEVGSSKLTPAGSADGAITDCTISPDDRFAICELTRSKGNLFGTVLIDLKTGKTLWSEDSMHSKWTFTPGGEMFMRNQVLSQPRLYFIEDQLPVSEDLQEHLATLKSSQPEERLRAMSRLARLGEKASAAGPRLVEALDDPDADVRAAAAATLVAGHSKQGSVVIDFYADWCGPCRQMKPTVEKLRKEGFPLMTVDTDANPGLSARYNIQNIPTFVLLKASKEIKREVGGISEMRLRKMVESCDGKVPALILDPKNPAGRPAAFAAVLACNATDEWQRAWGKLAMQQSADQVKAPLRRIVAGKNPILVRVAAVVALVDVLADKDAHPVLRKLAIDPAEPMELRGYAALGLPAKMVESPEVQPALLALLRSSSTEARYRAAVRLGEARVVAALPDLIANLDGNPLRLKFAKVLGAYGNRATQAIPALLKLYGQDRLTTEAADALRQIVDGSNDAVPHLIEGLQAQPSTRRYCLELLLRVPDPRAARAAAEKALDDSSGQVNAALLLLKLGQQDDRVMSVLLKFVSGGRGQQSLREMGMRGIAPLVACVVAEKQPLPARRSAANVLSSYTQLPRRHVARLREALGAQSQEVQTCAALVLARQQRPTSGLVPALLAGTRSSDADLQRECLDALASSPDLNSAINADATKFLLELCKRNASENRSEAVEVLARLKLDETTQQAVTAMLKSPERIATAARILAGGKRSQETEAALIEALASAPDDQARTAVVNALNIIRPAPGPLVTLAVNEKASPEARQAALKVLGSVALPEHVGALTQLLKSKNSEIRRRGAIVLMQIDPRQDFIAAVVEGLKVKGDPDESPESALAGLGEKGAAALDPLCDILESGPSVETRQAILRALTSIPVGSPRATRNILANLRPDLDDESRQFALFALLNRNAVPVAAITEALADPKAARSSLLQALREHGPSAREAVPHIEKLLSDRDGEVARAAALALARIDPANEAAVPVLLERASLDSASQRAEALMALGQYRSAAGKSVPLLLAALERPETRFSAYFPLTQLGPAAAPAVPALVDRLTTPDSAQAAQVLGAIGPAASAAAPDLLRLLQQETGLLNAARALGQIGGDGRRDALKLLTARLRDEDERPRIYQALAELGQSQPDIVGPILLKQLVGGDLDERTDVIFALGMLRWAGAAGPLAELLKDRDRDVAVQAALALADCKPDPAIALEPLSRALKADDPKLRHAAVRGIRNLGPAAAAVLPALLALLDDPDIRQDALETIGGLRDKGAPAIERITVLLNDPDAGSDAIFALGSIGPAAKAALPRLQALRGSAHTRILIQQAIRRIEGKASPDEMH